MSTIGSLGVGSGLDLNGLLDKMQAVEQIPLNQIKSRQSAYNARISGYGAVQSLLSSLRTASDKLGDASFMNGFKASSSAPDALAASSDSTAVGGSYSVAVSRLAQAQSLVSSGVAGTSDQIGADAATITIQFGRITGTLDVASGTYQAGATYAPDGSKTPISVSLAAGATSLADIRDAINAAAGGALSASIVNDGSSNRLVLASTATGQNSSMRITVGGTNTDLQNLLGNDPQGTQALRQTSAAQDAALTVNGIAITSSSNTVAGAIQGVTLTLASAGSGTVKVDRDAASVKSAIADFVNAYNKLATKLVDMTAYSTDKRSGVLLGDSTVRIVQARLRAIFFEPHTGLAGDPSRLSEIGIGFQRDGTLAINDTTLGAALGSNPSGVTRLFAGNSSSDTTAIAKRFSAVVDTLIADVDGEDKDGLLTVVISGVKKTVTRLDKDAMKLQDRIDARMAIYRAQFQQLDMVMSGMSATSSYLSQQFAKQTTK